MYRAIRSARLVSTYLGRVPSVMYGMTYLFALVLFAGLYTFFSRQFFHTALDKERLTSERRAYVSESIEAAIRKPLGEPSLIVLPDGWVTVGGAVGVEDFRFDFDSDRLIVTVSTFVVRHEDGKLVAATLIVEARAAEDLDTYQRDIKLVEFKSDPPLSSALREELYKQVFVLSRNSRRILELPSATFEALYEMNRATKGRATPGWDTFLRMLYFSAITITTVGYGDIVPITTFTRLLVGIEAVMGVVLVGLFLNSIAHEARADDGKAISAKAG